MKLTGKMPWATGWVLYAELRGLGYSATPEPIGWQMVIIGCPCKGFQALHSLLIIAYFKLHR
jgi:hypothetical protein